MNAVKLTPQKATQLENFLLDNLTARYANPIIQFLEENQVIPEETDKKEPEPEPVAEK